MLEISTLPHQDLGWSLDKRDPQFIEAMMPALSIIYNFYFRVYTSGWENVPDEKVLVVGSHNGGLASPDTSMMLYDWIRRFGTERPIYGLMHPKVWEVFPQIVGYAMKAGAVRAHPKMAHKAFKAGATVLVYPGGAEDVFRPYQMRDQIYFAGRKGFIKLALRENVPILPAISWGAHDTLIVLTDLYKYMRKLHQLGMPWILNIDPLVFPVYLGMPWGLALGPLPNIPFPKQIHTRVCKPIRFNRYGRKAASDRSYVDECYELVQTQMQQELDDLIKEVGKN